LVVVLFDTLKASIRLREAGFDEEQAGAIVSAFAEDIGERLATREDIGRIEDRLIQLDERVETTEERLEQRLALRVGIMVTAATSMILTAIGIATGVLASL